MPIPVYYRPEMSVRVKSYSPSADKPRQAVTDWIEHGLDVRLVQPFKLEQRQLYWSHDPSHVDAIFEGRKPNGFGTNDTAVAESTLYTVGAMASAATAVAGDKEADRKGGVACAPVSGFHHAGRSYCSGFCTFNGLMVALDLVAQQQELEYVRAGILDLDYHYGDGTDDILDGTGKASSIKNISFGNRGRRMTASQFLKALPEWVEEATVGMDIVLYQAGADMHVDDPLGGLLTTEQMAERDRIVFTTFKRKRSPYTGLVWNLAGGYQTEPDDSIPKVLEIHRNTMKACIAAFGKE